MSADLSKGDSEGADSSSGFPASDELLALLYAELKGLARDRLAREGDGGGTLEPTALVHEAWLRLGGIEGAEFRNRGHFFGAAGIAMRRVLVERARRMGRLKRGGDRKRVTFGDPVAEREVVDDRVLAVDEAVQRLESADPRKARLIELRFFAGLGVRETAEALGVSAGTVEREWRFTRAWLRSELEAGEEKPEKD